MKKLPFILGAVVLVIAGLLVWFFLSTFTLVERPQSLPPSELARRDGRLALERIFQRQGVAVQRFDSHQNPDPASDLIVADNDWLARQTSAQLTAWRTWLEAGGRLVLFWSTAETSTFLPDLGLYPSLDTEGPTSPGSGYFDNPLPEGDTKALTISLDQRFRLELEAESLADEPRALTWIQHAPLDGEDEVSLQLVWLQLTVEKGWLAVTGRGWLLENEQLTQHDNEAFVQRLFAGAQRVALQKTDRLQGGAFIPEAWYGLILPLAVLAVLLVWRGLVRTAPPLPAPEPERRSLAERFAAEGRYLTRIKPPKPHPKENQNEH